MWWGLLKVGCDGEGCVFDIGVAMIGSRNRTATVGFVKRVVLEGYSGMTLQR